MRSICLFALFVAGCATEPMATEHLVTRDRGESYQGVHREEVESVIKSGVPSVLGCYDSVSARNKGLKGKVIAIWSIIDSGQVKDVAIKNSTLNNSPIESCVVAKIRTWKFAPLAKGKEAEITYPFVFY